MTITANSGPFISYGITVSASGGQGEYNEHRGPSLVDLGDGLLDPRQQYNYGYQPGQGSSQLTFGFWGLQAVVDFVPNPLSSNNIALNQAPVANTALTLTASGVGVTSVTITAPETQKSTTVLCIDGPCGGSTSAGVQFGQTGSIEIWNPNTVCGRCISIVTSSNLDSGGYSIAGRDVYGFKVTETVSTAAGGGVYTSKKAYKYITTILTSGTVTSTGVVVGTVDTFGFPFFVNHPGYINMWIGAASSATIITANTGNHTFGSSLATATSTNGDVRGTYASSVATSNSSMRVVMFVSPMIAMNSSAGTLLPSSVGGLNSISAANYAGLFGAAQFSSV